MKNTLFFAATAALLPALLAAPAQAQTQTFAQYSVVNTTGQNTYTFTNLGPASVLVTIATPVTFVYNIANGYSAAGTNIAATLNLAEIVSATATSTSIPGSGLTYLYQPLSLTSLTLTANTPVGGQSNLLTVANSTGNVSGFSGGNIATDGGDTATGDTVNFSSDFLSFTGSTARNYNISLTSVNPFLALSGGYLRPFTANGNGSFAFTPAPEPSGLLTLLVMGGGLALCAARRRRTSSC